MWCIVFYLFLFFSILKKILPLLTDMMKSLFNSKPTEITTPNFHDLVDGNFGEGGMEFPEHALKIYKSDQQFKYLLVHQETSAKNVVMLALQEFGITELSSNYTLCEVNVKVS